MCKSLKSCLKESLTFFTLCEIAHLFNTLLLGQMYNVGLGTGSALRGGGAGRGYKTGGGHVKFYPYERGGGGADNVLPMLKGGGGGHTQKVLR